MKRGIGWVTQGIFIQANNSNFINKNFSIEWNILETSHIHWITIIDWQNISVKNNSVTTSTTPVVTPISITEELKNPKIRFYRINSWEITGNTTNWVDLIDSVNIVQ